MQRFHIAPCDDVFILFQPAIMTVQPANHPLRGSQPHAVAMARMPDHKPEHPFAPQPSVDRDIAPFRLLLARTLIGVTLLFAAFGDDAASQVNRRAIRLTASDIQDFHIALQHLASPLPWHTQSPNVD